MEFSRIGFWSAVALVIEMPIPVLNAMTLPAPAAVPPIVTRSASALSVMPFPPLAMPAEPAALVPM